MAVFKKVIKEEMIIPAEIRYLPEIRDFIVLIGRKYHFSDKTISAFKLALDEACTNIIRHGYRDKPGGTIKLRAIVRRASLTIVVVDSGKTFDIRQAKNPDLQRYIDIGKKGGLGIFMMRKLLDDIDYRITTEGNELRLSKNRDLDELKVTGPLAFWQSLTLKTRFSIAAVIALTLLVAIIGGWLYNYQDQRTRNSILSNGINVVEELASNSRNDLANLQDLPLFRLVKNVKENNYLIKDAFITDTTNRALATTNLEIGLESVVIPTDAKRIFKQGQTVVYQFANSRDSLLYDFQTPIQLPVGDSVQVIGQAHIQIGEMEIQDQIQKARLFILYSALSILFISLVGSTFFVSRVMNPFIKLADFVRQTGHSIVEDEMEVDATDEIGQIAKAFSEMTNKIREAQHSLVEQQRLQKEIQVAQQIQQMLLPSQFPTVEGYDIATYYESAKEVGGDLFDFVEIDADSVGVVVADVSGKGVPGSLVMTMIRTTLRLEARESKLPSNVLINLNSFVRGDIKKGMFVTMFYVVMDSRRRIIQYCSAGHNPMILYRSKLKKTYYLNPRGFPVGITTDDDELFARTLSAESIKLNQDDILILYTDGITEAMNSNRELFGEERFLFAIRKFGHLPVKEFIESVKEEINNFTGGYQQSDDITIVAIKEKVRSSDLLYKLRCDLFKKIYEDSLSVTEACKQLRVSPSLYYRYKSSYEALGYDGLRDEEIPDISARYLSVEEKVLLYDIVKERPEFGPKKISDELNSEPYGYTQIDERRIYEELVRAKLNTQEMREAFVNRGGKKRRYKAPGTPLLTLDGQVILDKRSYQESQFRTEPPPVKPAPPSLPPTFEKPTEIPKLTPKPPEIPKPVESSIDIQTPIPLTSSVITPATPPRTAGPPYRVRKSKTEKAAKQPGKKRREVLPEEKQEPGLTPSPTKTIEIPEELIAKVQEMIQGTPVGKEVAKSPEEAAPPVEQKKIGIKQQEPQIAEGKIPSPPPTDRPREEPPKPTGVPIKELEKEKIISDTIINLIPKPAIPIKNYFHNELQVGLLKLGQILDGQGEDTISSMDTQKVMEIIKSLKMTALIQGYEAIEYILGEVDNLVGEMNRAKQNLNYADTRKLFQHLDEAAMTGDQKILRAKIGEVKVTTQEFRRKYLTKLSSKAIV